MRRNIFGIFSGLSGLLIIIIDVAFTVWSSFAKPWYTYTLNFFLLFIASSVINTSYIQGLTRGFSYIYLFKTRCIYKAIIINLPTLLSMTIAYLISKYVFSLPIQIALFFIVCIFLSTIVAFVDGAFQIAIERTKMFEKL